jgi:hypothetical protein
VVAQTAGVHPATVKLDARLVRRVTTPEGAVAAAAVVELAKSLGAVPVAVGVETEAEAAALRRLGCVAGQGHLWSPALGVTGLAARLAECRAGATGRVLPEASPEPGLTAEHGLTRLLQLHLGGASPATIAAALNREGYRSPTGVRWQPKAVEQALAVAAA